MTPKEKAEYLVNRFYNESLCVLWGDAIECAIIVCDEMDKMELSITMKSYWYEVRVEILKLK